MFCKHFVIVCCHMLFINTEHHLIQQTRFICVYVLCVVSTITYILPLLPSFIQVRTKDMLFESISHLISYHLKNELPIVAAESELHLKQVVRRKQ